MQRTAQIIAWQPPELLKLILVFSPDPIDAETNPFKTSTAAAQDNPIDPAAHAHLRLHARPSTATAPALRLDARTSSTPTAHHRDHAAERRRRGVRNRVDAHLHQRDTEMAGM